MIIKTMKSLLKKYFPEASEIYSICRHNRNFKKRKLEIHLADHCNLNCRCCNHYSPIADKKFVQLTDLESMYEELKPYYHRYFEGIILLGGEPLLNPEIENIIKLTTSYFSETNIEIITNGIKLFSISDSFWDICKEKNILISITEYPNLLDIDRLKIILNEKMVSYRIFGFRETFTHECLDEKGSSNKKTSWMKCYVGGKCLQLRNGKIYPCAQSAYIEYINKAFNTKFKHDSKDTLDLSDLKSRYKFWKFVNVPKPFCRYCNWDLAKKEKWGKSQKSRKEWLKG